MSRPTVTTTRADIPVHPAVMAAQAAIHDGDQQDHDRYSHPCFEGVSVIGIYPR
jgi:hypothetical protein